MAKIRYAAKRIKEGSAIRRAGWAPGVCYRKGSPMSTKIVLDWGNGQAPSRELELLVEDLLATDWEVVRE
jgi:hypothetical protein